jgi:hypothetical protein
VRSGACSCRVDYDDDQVNGGKGLRPPTRRPSDRSTRLVKAQLGQSRRPFFESFHGRRLLSPFRCYLVRQSATTTGPGAGIRPQGRTIGERPANAVRDSLLRQQKLEAWSQRRGAGHPTTHQAAVGFRPCWLGSPAPVHDVIGHCALQPAASALRSRLHPNPRWGRLGRA